MVKNVSKKDKIAQYFSSVFKSIILVSFSGTKSVCMTHWLAAVISLIVLISTKLSFIWHLLKGIGWLLRQFLSWNVRYSVNFKLKFFLTQISLRLCSKWSTVYIKSRIKYLLKFSSHFKKMTKNSSRRLSKSSWLKSVILSMNFNK